MRKLRALIIRLAGLFHRRSDHEMDEEFRAHLEMQIEDNLRAGMPPEEARRAALVKSGGIQAARENYRKQRGLPFVEILMQDLRFSLRTLRKTPGFTTLAVLTLALGIGANTAMFSVINAVLLRPLPYRAPDRLVQLFETEAAPGKFPFAGPDYLDWQAQNKTLQSSSLFSDMYFNLSRGGDSQGVLATRTQANFFSTLGVSMLRGRSFAPGEDHEGRNHVVVLSFGLWQSFFGGRDDVLNKTVQLDGGKYTVIGVLPSWFRFRSSGLYMPLDMGAGKLGRRGNHSYFAIGRLKPETTLAAAQADLSSIAQRLEKQYPGSNHKVGAQVVDLKEQATGHVRNELLLMLGAVALVLLVACANLANMLLVRSSSRQREIALRKVLGAGRGRILRQLLTESLLLSLSGAALGLVGAWWCVRAIQGIKALPIPRQTPIHIDANVLLFTMAAGIAVGVLFGLAPALHATQLKLGDELKNTAQAVVSPAGRMRLLRDFLVVAEIGLSLGLLAGAGLLLKSFTRMRNADIGIDPDNVITFNTFLPASRYMDDSSQRLFVEQLSGRIEALPGVKSVAFSNSIPLQAGSNGPIKVEGDTNPSHGSILVEQNFITPQYFQTYGIPVLSGENFSAAAMDRAWQVNRKLEELAKANPNLTKVPPGLGLEAVISKATADTFWPGQDVVGKTYIWGGMPVKVIGVVADAKESGIRQPVRPQAYYPISIAFSSNGGFGASVSIKTKSAPDAMWPGVRNALRSVDSSLAMFHPKTMEQIIADDVQDAGVSTFLLTTFAGLALLLAAVGLYGVLSYVVSQRTREIGIRMALGAQRGDVLRLVMQHAVLLTSVGLGIGLLLALAGGGLIKAMLFGVTTHDPVTFAAVVLVLGSVALIACLVPARRAMRVDPMVAIRYE